jgi:hypothetical protein
MPTVKHLNIGTFCVIIHDRPKHNNINLFVTCYLMIEVIQISYTTIRFKSCILLSVVSVKQTRRLGE